MDTEGPIHGSVLRSLGNLLRLCLQEVEVCGAGEELTSVPGAESPGGCRDFDVPLPGPAGTKVVSTVSRRVPLCPTHPVGFGPLSLTRNSVVRGPSPTERPSCGVRPSAERGSVLVSRLSPVPLGRAGLVSRLSPAPLRRVGDVVSGSHHPV